MSNRTREVGPREFIIFSVVHLLIYLFIVVLAQLIDPTAYAAARLAAIVGGLLCLISLITLMLSRIARV